MLLKHSVVFRNVSLCLRIFEFAQDATFSDPHNITITLIVHHKSFTKSGSRG